METTTLYWVIRNPGRIVCNRCLRNEAVQKLTKLELNSEFMQGISDCEDCGARDSRDAA